MIRVWSGTCLACSGGDRSRTSAFCHGVATAAGVAAAPARAVAAASTGGFSAQPDVSRQLLQQGASQLSLMCRGSYFNRGLWQLSLMCRSSCFNRGLWQPSLMRGHSYADGRRVFLARRVVPRSRGMGAADDTGTKSLSSQSPILLEKYSLTHF